MNSHEKNEWKSFTREVFNGLENRLNMVTNNFLMQIDADCLKLKGLYAGFEIFRNNPLKCIFINWDSQAVEIVIGEGVFNHLTT